ncbi:MAG: mechanosensitive ion channel family protein [Pseudobdellovibrio sp.]
MNTKAFPLNLYNFLEIDIYVFIGVLCLFTFVFYKFFLKKVSASRHQSIQNHLKTINKHFFALSIFFIIYIVSHEKMEDFTFFKKVTPYIAVATYLIGVFLFVRVCRLNVLMYLFLSSMRAGVPLLLVNIFSLIFAVVIGFWSISSLFGVQLTPLLATSAAFSLILGLALQDTLGNLFAGISLQIDKTFELDDWLEIQNGPNKIVGQVRELTWRSTVLTGLSDEVITLPNKVVALSQISNYSPDNTPIMRSQIIRLAHNQDYNRAKDLLESAVSQIADVRAIPSPFTYISDINESWTSIKVLYFIDNYGRQFIIGDKVFNLCQEVLYKNGFSLANQVIEYKQTPILTINEAPNGSR